MSAHTVHIGDGTPAGSRSLLIVRNHHDTDGRFVGETEIVEFTAAQPVVDYGDPSRGLPVAAPTVVDDALAARGWVRVGPIEPREYGTFHAPVEEIAPIGADDNYRRIFERPHRAMVTGTRTIAVGDDRGPIDEFDADVDVLITDAAGSRVDTVALDAALAERGWHRYASVVPAFVCDVEEVDQ